MTNSADQSDPATVSDAASPADSAGDQPDAACAILEAFSCLDDWMDRYEYIIELGQALPKLSDEHKIPGNLVAGCQSQVWLIKSASCDKSGTIKFAADSDAHIVRGLVAMLLELFSGRTPEEIARYDPQPIFAQLGLDQHLSPGRNSGLLAMVGRIKELARGAEVRRR